MNAGWFDQPVRVVIEPRGNIADTITNTVQAADVLLNRWPSQTGAKHLAARKACMAVLEGVKEARAARKAFEAAAKEAGILAQPLRPVSLDSEAPKLWRNGKRRLKRDL